MVLAGNKVDALSGCLPVDHRNQFDPLAIANASMTKRRGVASSILATKFTFCHIFRCIKYRIFYAVRSQFYDFCQSALSATPARSCPNSKTEKARHLKLAIYALYGPQEELYVFWGDPSHPGGKINEIVITRE